LHRWSGLALALAVALGCSGREPRIPPGAYLAGDAGALRRVLARLEPRNDVPMGRAARELRQRLEGCVRVFGHSSSGDPRELFAALTCAPPDDPEHAPRDAEWLRSLRGNAELVLVVPVGETGRLSGPIRVDPQGGVTFDAHLALPEISGPASVWVPSEQPPGPAVLNASDALIHARMRAAGGLPIADWVPRGSQGDQMFRLKSELFAGTVLDGTWELVVYLPESGASTPPAALAVGYRLRSAAQVAAEDFVAALRATWPLQRSAIALAQGEASCLSDLRILPDLSPCWWLGEHALVVAWNEASLRRALASSEPAELAPDGGMIVRLDRFAQADANLQAGLGPIDGLAPLDYAWRRAELLPRRSEQGVDLTLRLVAGSGS
jgi:hypothetical protein